MVTGVGNRILAPAVGGGSTRVGGAVGLSRAQLTLPTNATTAIHECVRIYSFPESPWATAWFFYHAGAAA
jgi:hypothetical protein